ncbi:hypothetical protein ONR57_12590 [Hoyosella sp. YIM 151337]|uniref:hypothetical protein n=1 Tax=Hoyosella sp. YIM 151337 TaxID=2992742 RepID=UPI002236A4E4|nr:hypothetical protein [Hoyosella sp. YIM 151337]MCW4354138.1 hypothetical protein [Hoyosella sp. YIM 151337]
MNMLRNGARGIVVTATCAASVLAMSYASLAQKTDGPVRFSAVGNDQCEVTFTIENDTNSRFYTIDYLIDDEQPTGPDFGTGPTGRRVLNSAAQEPLGPPGYVRNRPTEVSTVTVDLREVEDRPNVGADSYLIRYRMILGPSAQDRGPGTFYETTVTGCADPEPPTGSIRIDLGSLIGSLQWGSSS